MTRGILSKAWAFYDTLIKYTYVGACAVLVLCMILINLNVGLRYAAGLPIVWGDEVIGYSMLFLTFMSASWILRSRGHVTMDILTNRLGLRAQAKLNFVTMILASMMWLVITFYGVQVVVNLFQTKAVIDTVLEPLKAYIVILVPIGSGLLFIQSLREAFQHLRGEMVSPKHDRIKA